MPPGAATPRKQAARWNELLQRARRRGQAPAPLAPVWEDATNRRVTSYMVARDRMFATDQSGAELDQSFLAAVNLKDGSDLWVKALPAGAVKGGSATDQQGNIFVVLNNGQLMCFEPDQSNGFQD